jgi:cytochrome oxidase Cu insertion factor (SCO1/SenC/PrrC family)
MKIRSIFALFVFVSGIFAFSIGASAQAASPEDALNVGAAMPAFELKDSTGKSVSSKDLERGKFGYCLLSRFMVPVLQYLPTRFAETAD